MPNILDRIVTFYKILNIRTSYSNDFKQFILKLPFLNKNIKWEFLFLKIKCKTCFKETYECDFFFLICQAM